jgi:hypothetical protein
MTRLPPLSFGLGDRFAAQGEAQLRAVTEAARLGIMLAPVWNKSNREHLIVKSEPMSVRREADAAVAALGWTGPYFVDADHINLGNVEPFLGAADFYTIDVADHAGRAAAASEIESFAAAARACVGTLASPGLDVPLVIDEAAIARAGRQFLAAMQEAGRIYRFIAERKGDAFVAEVSVDETDGAQTPAELLLILLMLAREKVPCQAIAPKFSGRFNKGVDYVGDLARFGQEFDEDLCVVAFAIREFGLPETLKLSVHSGSDKFSLYPVINRLLKKRGAGVHVKTAGTTWLEEVIGLAEAGGDGLEIAREIYAAAHGRFSELVKPYAAVVDIDPGKLPAPAEVKGWTSAQFTAALRHDASRPEYNRDFRQLIHVAFKVAAANLLDRHIVPIFA